MASPGLALRVRAGFGSWRAEGIVGRNLQVFEKLQNMGRMILPMPHDHFGVLAMGVGERSYSSSALEAGKGDHKHIGTLQVSCRFSGLTQLQAYLRADVESWQEERQCGPSR